MAIDWDAVVGSPVTNVFGESVTYTTVGGQSFPLTGNYTEGAVTEESLGEAVPATITDPTLGVQYSAFPPGIVPLQGDQAAFINPVSKAFETFTVKDVRPDGQGTAYLKLNFVR
jgi:hypothetical protein